jgi:hypothetical protein
MFWLKYFLSFEIVFWNFLQMELEENDLLLKIVNAIEHMMSSY